MELALLSAMLSHRAECRHGDRKSAKRKFLDHIKSGHCKPDHEQACKKKVLEVVTSPAVVAFCSRNGPKKLMEHFQHKGFPTHSLDKARCALDALELLYRCRSALEKNLSEAERNKVLGDVVENSAVNHSTLLLGLIVLVKRKITFTEVSVMSSTAEFIMYLVPFVEAVINAEDVIKDLNEEMTKALEG